MFQHCNNISGKILNDCCIITCRQYPKVKPNSLFSVAYTHFKINRSFFIFLGILLFAQLNSQKNINAKKVS